jgi:rhomboid protease GluP
MNGNRRQSILCPNCRKLISTSESACPYCGLRRPAVWWKGSIWNLGLRDPRLLIRNIIAANIGMYAVALLLNPSVASLNLNPLSFLAPDDRSLFLLGMTGTIPIDRFERWWTLLSANYLHGGILHIFFNMAAFRQLAPLVAAEFGTHRMFTIYTIGGILGFLVSYLAGVRYTIGASAAVCSLIGAALYFGKSRGGVYGMAVYRQIGVWALGLFAIGFLVPGINNWGHGGGIVSGALLGYVLGYREKSPERLGHRVLAGICVSLTIAVLGWALVTGVIYRLMS